MGTNVDCYQRAEGRYRLMPGIIGALKDAGNPFSILTKGTLILRDIDLLAEAAEVTDVGLNISAGFVDKELWRSVEPGTPDPARRLEACAALNDRGLRCGVLMGPVIPFLSDSPAQLDAAVRQIAAAGRHARDADRAAPAPGHPGVVPSAGWALITPGWSAGISTCTAAAPTRRSPIRPGSPARSASSRPSTASAARGPCPAGAGGPGRSSPGRGPSPVRGPPPARGGIPARGRTCGGGRSRGPLPRPGRAAHLAVTRPQARSRARPGRLAGHERKIRLAAALIPFI